MNETDRRFVLQTLGESQYRDVMNVCSAMPDIEIQVECEGLYHYNLLVINVF